MEENARRFARRILTVHVLLLLAVLAVVGLAAREIYNSTREQVIGQAESRQSMLASQSGRAIESYYQSILNNLDLLRRAESDEPAGDRPATNPALPDRAVSAAGTAGVIGPVGSPLGATARAAIVGPILWKQLEGRVSLLFGIDRSMLSRAKPTIRIIGSDELNLSPEEVVARSRSWLESVQTPSVGPFQTFGSEGVNLICIPYPRGRLVIAVVPVRNFEEKFLRSLNDDTDTGTWVIDDQLTAMAASRPALVGVNMAGISDPGIRSLAADYIQNGRSGTEVIYKPFSIGSTNFVPSLVSANPVVIGNVRWELFISSSLNNVDGIVSRLFRRAIFWGAIVVMAITGILVSTAIQMIRGRIRSERLQHDLLTRELDQAREIQLAWLPAQGPPKSAIDIAAINSPASHISGDFYNWFDLPDGRLVVTIGDVTGHGMSAAFLMATTQLLVRNTMARLGDPAACLEEVNRQLCVQVFNGQFVTMLVMVVDVTTGALEVATAGHPAPLMADGESFQPLRIEPQMLLGVERDATFVTERFTLTPQSTLLLYTDGVVECAEPTGTRFSTDGLQRSLYGRYDSAQAIVDRVITAVDTFRGPLELADDLTLVAIQMLDPSVATAMAVADA